MTAYVAGPSLQTAVREHGPLPVETVRALGAGLGEGLMAIHAFGVVHRDLKPSNIIIASDGPRVIDFGIARALEMASLTSPSVVLGTPSFMSPEQVLAREHGPPGDVFALGSVLAFAATGRGAFGEGHPWAVLNNIVQAEPDLADGTRPAADIAMEPYNQFVRAARRFPEQPAYGWARHLEQLNDLAVKPSPRHQLTRSGPHPVEVHRPVHRGRQGPRADPASFRRPSPQCRDGLRRGERRALCGRGGQRSRRQLGLRRPQLTPALSPGDPVPDPVLAPVASSSRPRS